MKAATACLSAEPDRAAALLESLVFRADAAHQRTITGWHLRQARSLLAEVEQERGAAATAADLHERVAREARDEHRAARLEAAARFAEAALCRFELGQTDRALSLAEQAFALADLHADPGTVFERLIAEVRRIRLAKPDAD